MFKKFLSTLLLLQFSNAALPGAEPAGYKPIDPATVAAYEKLGATYGCFDIFRLESAGFMVLKPAPFGRLPGFHFKPDTLKKLPKQLPAVDVPFGLDLSYSKITHDDLAALENLNNLTMLNLMATKVTDPGFKHLAGLKNIELINLFGVKVGDDGLANLKDFKKLRILCLHATLAADQTLKELEGLENLRELDLRSTKVTDAGMKYLKSFSELKAST